MAGAVAVEVAAAGATVADLVLGIFIVGMNKFFLSLYTRHPPGGV